VFPVKHMLGAIFSLAVFAFAFAGCATLSEPAMESHAPTLPAAHPPLKGLKGQFFGTTTILLRDDDHAILIDGFFSRPSGWELLLGLGKIKPDERRIAEALEFINPRRVDRLLVAHSHHDHAMDSPIVAEQTGATLVGSESVRNIASGLLRDHVPFRLADPEQPMSVGEFRINFFVRRHAHYKWTLLEDAVKGDIHGPLTVPAKIWDYKVGTNYVFSIEHPQAKILIVPSASDALSLGAEADVVFLSIANVDLLTNAQITTYWKEAVVDTKAKLVVPVHWDNFARALDKDKPLEPFPAFIDNVACAMETLMFLNERKVDIQFMPLFKPVALDNRSIHQAKRRDSGEVISVPNPFTHGCRVGRT
jgi:L-ascorbate metabolism protein UlaG (beta-lactamase superfamily)